jgi:hypothetical protein
LLAASKGHVGGISACEALLERHAVTAGHDRTIRLWKTTAVSDEEGETAAAGQGGAEGTGS